MKTHTPYSTNLPGPPLFLQIYVVRRVLYTRREPGFYIYNCSTTSSPKYETKRLKTPTQTQHMYPGRKPFPSLRNYTQCLQTLKITMPTTQPGQYDLTRVQFKPPETQKPQIVFKSFQNKIQDQNINPLNYTHIHAYTFKNTTGVLPPSKPRNHHGTQSPKHTPKSETQNTSKQNRN